MCGISGIVTKSIINHEELHDMMGILHHRGPDANDIYINNESSVGFAHNRLSIIDLSENANQPFHSSCGRYVITYNGEVYNFLEIKKELESFCKHAFRTTSDTEVIVEAFAKWGPECVKRFNGMFAFAINDKKEKLLYLFRDRIGKKPLYYYYDGQELIFASELKAIVGLSRIKSSLKVNQRAIYAYLHLGYIPEPLTIYEKVFKFPSAHYAVINEALEIKWTRFWNPLDHIHQYDKLDFNQAKEILKELLISSVNYRLISDVPLGVFLSGGVDSSLVAAIAQSLKKEPIKTFSIGFKENKFDESGYAKQVANYLKTDHHEYILEEREAIELVNDLVKVYDEPYADSSSIPTLLISRLTRQQVKVALTGDGGDELFMGYGAYIWANRLDNPFIKILSPLLRYSLYTLGSNKYKRASALFENVKKNQIRSHIFSQEQYFFSHSEIKSLIKDYDPELQFQYDESILDGIHMNPAEKQAFFDLNFYLKDDLMVKVDRASMHHSLECRSPLLDYRIIEFALGLPYNLKISNGTAKYLLKEVLYDYLPKEFFNRPKWGFAVPVENWLFNKSYYLMPYEAYAKFQFMKIDQVNKILKRHKNGQSYLYNRLWNLIQLLI